MAATTVAAQALRRSIHAGTGGPIGGLSPAALALVWFDRALQAAVSPGRQSGLAGLGLDLAARFLAYAARREILPLAPTEPAFGPSPGKRRLAEEAGRRFPCNMAQCSFLMTAPVARGSNRTPRRDPQPGGRRAWLATMAAHDRSWWTELAGGLATCCGSSVAPPMEAWRRGLPLLEEPPGAHVRQA